jgi:hypothetical protein
MLIFLDTKLILLILKLCLIVFQSYQVNLLEFCHVNLFVPLINFYYGLIFPNCQISLLVFHYPVHL